MKVFSSDCTFDYSWAEVSTANWRKYCPWNTRSTHVIAVDTLCRSIDPSSHILRTERLITCKQNAPAWLVSLFGGSDTSLVHETSYVDPVARKVTMVSTNLTWSNLLNVKETVVYEPEQQQQKGPVTRPEGVLQGVVEQQQQQQQKERTRFRQEARIEALCGGWQKIRTKIEEASVERFGENAIKGREGFEAVLETSRRVFGEERERVRAA
jgi:hypothetical protein